MPRVRNAPGYPYTQAGMERAVRTYMGAKRRAVDLPPRPPISIPADLAGYVQAGGGYRSMAARRTELKWFDTLMESAVIDATSPALLDSINLVQPGSGESNRVGKRINLRQIYLCGHVQTDDPITGTCLFRLFVILDKQANGLAPNAATLFSPALPTSEMMLNMENAQRFVVLKSLTRELTSQSYDATSGEWSVRQVPVEFCWDGNIPIDFSDADPTVLANVRSNNVLVVAAVSDLGTNTTRTFFNIRIRYTDS